MDEASSLRGRRVLIIEDDYFIAQILADLLEEAGAEVVGPVGWVEEAIQFIDEQSGTFDSAVLDVNLHGTRSYSIADALAARNIGFVFATGYGEEAVDGAYRRFPRCEKPFNTVKLLAALAAATAA